MRESEKQRNESALACGSKSPVLNRATLIAILVVLTAANLLVFYQILSHDFINYDDGFYIYLPSEVRTGLSSANILSAFTTSFAASWFPLTMISHMLDAQLFGLQAAWHHLHSLLLHMANTLLLFWVLNLMTRAPWRSAAVAALFAVHPLHVEAVAWASSRKDVLSGFFFLVTLLAYYRYAKQPSRKRLTLYLILFVLGLLAKTILVVLPAVLLLLDYWPLRRTEGGPGKKPKRKNPWGPLLDEKVAFIPLVAWFGTMQFLVQRSGGGVPGMLSYSIWARVSSAMAAYVGYVRNTFLPADLAVFYPHPKDSIPVWQALMAVLILCAITMAVFLVRRRLPYLLVGWLWYLVTLAPVIGFHQMGSHAAADRYTYLPLIGLFIALVWGLAEAANRWRPLKVIAPAAVTAAVLALTAVAWGQVGHWRNSVTLWEHALESTQDNVVTRRQLGLAYKSIGRLDDAIVEYGEAYRLAPDGPSAEVMESLEHAFAKQPFIDDAILAYVQSIHKGAPGDGPSTEVESALLDRNRACEKYLKSEEALRKDHYDGEAQKTLLGAADEFRQLNGRLRQTLEDLRSRPDARAFHLERGLALLSQDQPESAEGHFQEAIRIASDNPDAYAHVGNALMQQDEFDQALYYFLEAIFRDPNHARGLQGLEEAENAGRER